MNTSHVVYPIRFSRTQVQQSKYFFFQNSEKQIIVESRKFHNSIGINYRYLLFRYKVQSSFFYTIK